MTTISDETAPAPASNGEDKEQKDEEGTPDPAPDSVDGASAVEQPAAASSSEPSSLEQQQQPSSSDPPPQMATTTANSSSSTSPPANNNDDDGNAKPPTTRQAVLAPLPLDWTRMAECDDDPNQNLANIVRYPWDVMEIDPSETHLAIVGTHGQKITHMGSKLHERVSPNITNLVLRSHLIRTMEGIAGMKQLELLELYDNMVDELKELEGDGEDGLPGRNLRVLDISYNVIRDMGPVSLCPNLQELYIAQNKIKSIKGLKHLKLLRKIDLGANRIRVMEEEELSGLENLEELWLGKNKIEKIEGISKLTKLRRLDVQSNRLTSIENLEAQVDTLEELYLAHNGIDVEGAKCETGLALPFTQLNTIDLSRNRLVDTSPFAHLTALSDLWISGNDIKTFEDVEHLGGLTDLDSVYLEYNPVASEFEYRKKLAEMIPSLNQIDANMIGGLAQHGYMSVGGVGSGENNLVERMKQMQDAAIEKAKAEEQKLAAAEEEEEVKESATSTEEEQKDSEQKTAAESEENV
ncbi:hypothetical protein ACHAXR_008710 [Thalassiosira sp. AJA248-18]